jgi:YVTN family beta-propeller protein/uncharacterized repeat protein (TIGR03803 family)
MATIKRLATMVLFLAVATGMLFAAQNADNQATTPSSGKSSGTSKTEGFTVFADFTGSANGANPLYGNPQISNGSGYATTVAGGAYDEGTVFQASGNGTVTTLYTFCSQLNCTDGAGPFSQPLVVGGNIYGTTYWGGAYGQGTIYEVTPAGLLTTLHSFAGSPDGAYPVAGLVQVGGNFFGTTASGGDYNGGTIFEITPAGQLTTLYSFCSQSNDTQACTDGVDPYAGLIQGPNGNLYGTTVYGGASYDGTVFEFTLAGQLTTLYSFCSQSDCTDGQNPFAGLVLLDGFVYGTTTYGGANQAGTVFEITPTNQFSTLYSFCSLSGCADGLYPHDGLMLASDGNLYGTTSGGSGPDLVYSFGTVFGMTPEGELTTIHTFNKIDGSHPNGGLVEGSDDLLYGVTYYGGSQYDGIIFSIPVGLGNVPVKGKQVNSRNVPANFGLRGADLEIASGITPRRMGPTFPLASSAKARTSARARATTAKIVASSATAHISNKETLTTILDFDGADGAFPYNSLIQGTDGNLYGTIDGGGAFDQGTAFRVTTSGTVTTLYTFCSQTNCTDGVEPAAGLVQASNGNFYGTTSDGGANNGGGTVFEIAAGQLTTLYSFCSQPGCTDGNASQAPLVQATNGNLYGTTYAGGAAGEGTVFEITLSGQFTTVYSFCSLEDCADGAYPYAGLVQASNGNFYGTTSGGGATDFCSGCGTVFEITPAGQLTTLYNFCSQEDCADGSFPIAGLVQASNGNLYGTTVTGGANGEGTVFEITPAGQLTTVYNFCSQQSENGTCTDGIQPEAGLVQVGGNFYGTTTYGGADGFGTVFEITPAGQLTTLFTFDVTNGAFPEGALVQASNGNLYGMASFGGNRLDGTVFSFPPVISLLPPSGTAQVGVAYSSALVASDGVAPYTYSILIGALPPGLSLNSSTGAITGTPTMAGTYNFTAQVVDSQGNTATASCSIVVSPAALTLSGPTGTAQVNVAYSSVLNAAGGVPPYTFSIINGSLPPVLTLNTSTGAITGTPTTEGTYNFTAQVVDLQKNIANANCSIVVTSAGTSPSTTILTLAPSSIPVGSVGPIVMTATVAPASGSGTPTGSVTYFNGTTQVGTATLSEGSGTFSYNPVSLAVGIYSITAVYSGDGTFSASTSPAQTLAITQNGPFAYVANNGSNTVSVINIPTGQVANSILVGSGPSGTAISPDQTQVDVTNNLGNSVSVINAANGSVVTTIPVQTSPLGVAFTPDGSSVYVVNGSSNSVSVINTATQTVVATVPVQNSPTAVAMASTSNGIFAYVTNSASNTVSVIAVGNEPTVVQTIPVGTGPRWVTVSPNSMFAYVENAGSNNVSVISVASNQVTAAIPVGASPFGAAVTPDNSTLYVANSGSNNVSVIDTQSNTVISTVAGFNNPVQVALTTDGTSAYVTNLNANTVSVIATSTNTITGTVAVGNAPTGVAIASAPQMTFQITQPLNPTQQNTFNFGVNSYGVQYPPGTNFSGVNMTIAAVEITQSQFQQRVAGTQFANASCLVYTGTGGNCVDYEVTCSNTSGNPITCPSEATPSIAVQTGFSTNQSIVNPGFLTTPIGENDWQNIFTYFSDPSVHGKTKGFSEFVAVDLGATNPQGMANMTLRYPTLPNSFCNAPEIPFEIKLTSVANGKPVTDGNASLSVVKIANAKGTPTDQVVFSGTNVFQETGRGLYQYDLQTVDYAGGTYEVTIYGDAFAAFQGQLTIQRSPGFTCP